jgi:hypothetical protein
MPILSPSNHHRYHEEGKMGTTTDTAGGSAELVIRAQKVAPELYEALKKVTDLYCDLVNSGDAGFWDPEQVGEIKLARAALSKVEEA